MDTPPIPTPPPNPPAFPRYFAHQSVDGVLRCKDLASGGIWNGTTEKSTYSAEQCLKDDLRWKEITREEADAMLAERVKK